MVFHLSGCLQRSNILVLRVVQDYLRGVQCRPVKTRGDVVETLHLSGKKLVGSDQVKALSLCGNSEENQCQCECEWQ
jgi:hypothetical protein